MDKRDFYELLEAVPKAELHLHGEAVVSNETIKKLYKEKTGEDMREEQLRDLFAYDDLPGFLKSFLAIQGYFSSVDELPIVFKDFEDYVKQNNIVYAETFFAPSSLIKNGFDFSTIAREISKAIARTKETLGITVKVIVDVSRSFGLENAEHNLDLVLAEANPDIIGIGLGGDEAKGPAKDYATVFQRAKEHGLHRVLHAGETVDSWSMKDAITLCAGERLGHGISAAYDEEFLAELARTKLPIEACPTSNLYTKHYIHTYEEHPLRKLYDAGVLVTVNTDDPTFFKVSLIDEYWNAYARMGFALQDIRQLIKNGFTAAFLTDAEKAERCAAVDAAWDGWFQSHPSVPQD